MLKRRVQGLFGRGADRAEAPPAPVDPGPRVIEFPTIAPPRGVSSRLSSTAFESKLDELDRAFAEEIAKPGRTQSPPPPPPEFRPDDSLVDPASLRASLLPVQALTAAKPAPPRRPEVLELEPEPAPRMTPVEAVAAAPAPAALVPVAPRVPPRAEPVPPRAARTTPLSEPPPVSTPAPPAAAPEAARMIAARLPARSDLVRAFRDLLAAERAEARAPSEPPRVLVTQETERSLVANVSLEPGDRSGVVRLELLPRTDKEGRRIVITLDD